MKRISTILACLSSCHKSSDPLCRITILWVDDIALIRWFTVLSLILETNSILRQNSFLWRRKLLVINLSSRSSSSLKKLLLFRGSCFWQTTLGRYGESGCLIEGCHLLVIYSLKSKACSSCVVAMSQISTNKLQTSWEHALCFQRGAIILW